MEEEMNYLSDKIAELESRGEGYYDQLEICQTDQNHKFLTEKLDKITKEIELLENILNDVTGHSFS